MKNIFFFLGVGNLDRVLLSLVIIILIDWSIFFLTGVKIDWSEVDQEFYFIEEGKESTLRK